MLPVVMTTYLDLPEEQRQQRISAARKVVRSLEANSGPLQQLSFVIVHDGVSSSRIDPVSLSRCVHEIWTGGHSGVGASLNVGFEEAFKLADVALYVVDDWMLTQPFDFQPWIDLLERDAGVGQVRLGPPHPWLTGQIIFDDQCWSMKLDRHHYAMSFRPALWHRRMLEAYGPLPEGVNSYDAERLYNDHFGDTPGPDIHLALPDPWAHLETCELAGIVPGEAVRV